MARKLSPPVYGALGLSVAAGLLAAGCFSSSNGSAANAVGPYVWNDDSPTPDRVFEEDEEVAPEPIGRLERLLAGEERSVEPFTPLALGESEFTLGLDPSVAGTVGMEEAEAAEPAGEDRYTSPFGELANAPFGPREPEEWTTLASKGKGDTYSVQNKIEGLRIVDTVVQASERTALILYEHRGPYEDVVIEDSVLHVVPGTLPLNRSYWGIRGYDVIDMLLRRVEITGFGTVTDKHDEGHAIYLNLRGSFTMIGCDIHHNGGQGLQLVNRPAESDFPPGPAEGAITLMNTRFFENGFNPDRGGFQVSIFGTGQDIVMTDVLIGAGYDKTEYPAGQTGGALVIEAEPYDEWRKRPVWWRPEELPEDFEPPYTQGTVELVNVTIHHKDPNRPIVQIKGCETLYVRNCTFGAGRIELDAPNKPGRNCGKIVWQGNEGDAIVYVGGERRGRADEDFIVRD